MHIEPIGSHPPQSWTKLLCPPTGQLALHPLLRAQSVIHPLSRAPSSWKELLLSNHKHALKVDNDCCLGIFVCSMCKNALDCHRMPKFAVANGNCCGVVDHPSLKFPTDISEQEWKVMSLVIGRMQVRKIYGVQEGNSQRNGIRGQTSTNFIAHVYTMIKLLNVARFAFALLRCFFFVVVGHCISSHAPVAEALSHMIKLPCMEFANLHVHITGPMTSAQKARAVRSILIRREVVGS